MDRLKARLVPPEQAPNFIRDQELAAIIEQVYRVYDEALGAQNALDFGTILQKAHVLASNYSGISRNIRITYKHWSMDEFQDTNQTQYRIMKALAGAEFKNIYAVADDDQIIYQWNGACFARIEEFSTDFEPKFYQLPTNFRCPSEIVEVANRLIKFNKHRHHGKSPTVSGKPQQYSGDDVIKVEQYDTDVQEAAGIAEQIKSSIKSGRTIAVLARNKYIILPVKAALDRVAIASRIVQRRADFVSKEYGLAYNILRLCVRNRDDDVLVEVTEGLSEVINISIASEDIKARAKSTQTDYFVNLIAEIERVAGNTDVSGVLKILTALNERKDSPKEFMQKAIKLVLESEELSKSTPDMVEDGSAWQSLLSDIRQATAGSKIPLDRFLQELDMRSKEPPLKPGEVALMTIHGSKGTEFDVVFLAGVVEGTLPSWQSAQKGDESAEMEEERRNCFVAITRTRKCLKISYAAHYNCRQRDPSRFLSEMGLLGILR
jgi:DNA helicase-2/ATP-dependent DNA helicase PcrA